MEVMMVACHYEEYYYECKIVRMVFPQKQYLFMIKEEKILIKELINYL